MRLTDVASGIYVPGEGLAEILELFDAPLSPADAIRRLPGRNPVLVRARIAALRKLGFLLTERASKRARSRLRVWRGNAASAQYHAACRDLRYLTEPGEIESDFRKAVLGKPKAAPFKRYPRGRRIALPGANEPRRPSALERILLQRRTVRAFRRTPVSREDFARLFRMTFGISALLKSDVFGALIGRTSPSGGALHPIEAYAIVWNVEGLPRGVYHYDMGGELTRLRGGDFRAHAVRVASGQKWIGGAAFLCILTAVFPRVLWKYPAEDSYRTLFLDAGHLAQTFCLVATSLGLGPFTTAAIQDSKIEKLLRIDGIEEFPVYLCGAGVPARVSGRSARTAPAFPL